MKIVVVVADKMPPVVKNYCQWSPDTPQIHSWSGDLWLKSADENDLPSLLDDEDTSSTSCGSFLREDETPSESNCSQNEWVEFIFTFYLFTLNSLTYRECWI